MEAALFRYKGRVLVAVSYEFYDCHPAEYDFHLLRYENGVWREVTKQLLPVAPHKFHYYLLPRYGTTIKVTNEEGKTLYNLRWAGGKFLKARPENQ